MALNKFEEVGNIFTKPELRVSFNNNLDVARIASKLIGDTIGDFGEIVDYQINRQKYTGRLTSEKYLGVEPTAKRIYPSHSHFHGITTKGYALTVGAVAISNDEWRPYFEVTDKNLSNNDTNESRQESLGLILELAKLLSVESEVKGVSVRATLGGDWTPQVPGSESQEYLRLIRRPESINKFYLDPDDYWSAWDSVETNGDRTLVARSLDIVDTINFQRFVYPKIWELARKAYPGVCEYYAPSFSGLTDLRKSELDLFYEGEKCLRWVGYDPKKQIARASCYAEEGIHIPPHEIFGMHQVITSGKMQDGTPVKTLQIVFPSKEMAMREGVPLLDIGAQVLYLNRQMQDEELTAEDYARTHAS